MALEQLCVTANVCFFDIDLEIRFGNTSQVSALELRGLSPLSKLRAQLEVESFSKIAEADLCFWFTLFTIGACIRGVQFV